MSATGNEREASPARNESEWRRESGRGMGSFPRGVEVLIKKASVDVAFRERLFAQRGGAAAAIGLELDPAEAVMLSAIPPRSAYPDHHSHHRSATAPAGVFGPSCRRHARGAGRWPCGVQTGEIQRNPT